MNTPAHHGFKNLYRDLFALLAQRQKHVGEIGRFCWCCPHEVGLIENCDPEIDSRLVVAPHCCKEDVACDGSDLPPCDIEMLAGMAISEPAGGVA